MARNNDRDRGKKRAPARDTNRRGKAKVCIFCRDHITFVDYKDVNLLRRFISDRAKIKARRTTGTCVQHQRDVATAIKTAREVALIPYTLRTVSDRVGGREGRGRSGGRPQGDGNTMSTGSSGGGGYDSSSPGGSGTGGGGASTGGASAGTADGTSTSTNAGNGTETATDGARPEAALAEAE